MKHHGGHKKYWHHMQRKKVEYDHTVPIVYASIGEPGIGKTKWAYE